MRLSYSRSDPNVQDIENGRPVHPNLNDNQQNGPMFMKNAFGPPQRAYGAGVQMFNSPEDYINWRNQLQIQQLTTSYQPSAYRQACQLPVPHVPHSISLGHQRAYAETGKALPSARAILGHEMHLPIRKSTPTKKAVKIPHVEREDVLEAADILSTLHF